MIYDYLLHVHSVFEMYVARKGMRELKKQPAFPMKNSQAFLQMDSCKQHLREILIISVSATSYCFIQCRVSFFFHPQES